MLKRQFTCLEIDDQLQYENKIVDYYQEDTHLFDEQVCRVYVKSEQF